MKQMKHNKIEKWLENHLDFQDRIDYKNLRFIRENINYLGMGSPVAKLQIIRGHSFGYKLDNKKYIFFEMVDLASESSQRIFQNIFKNIENFSKKNNWQPLQHGRDYFIDDYLDEDAFLNIIPREKDGLASLKKAFNLILN